MTKKWIIIILLVGLAGLMASCQGNIFGWLYPEDDDEVDSDDVNDYIETGDIYLKKGNPKRAWEIFDSAVSKFPKSAIARQRAARAYILWKNVDIMRLLSSFMSGQGMGNAFKNAAQILGDNMNVYIGYLEPIINNETDGTIPMSDFELNVNLMLAYGLTGIIKIGDSNNDNKYFEDNDLVKIDSDTGMTAVNSNFLISLAFDLVAMASNMTQINTISKSEVTNVLMKSHDLLDSVLSLYKGVIGNFIKAKESWDRAKAKVTISGEMDEYQKEKGEISDKINDFFAKAMEDSNNYNSDYYKIAGNNVSGYDVNDLYWITDYSSTSWNSITPASSSPQNLYWDLINHVGDYDPNPVSNPLGFAADIMSIMSVISNSGRILEHIIYAKMINDL